MLDALTNPDSTSDAFDVVVMSLPGYGFSTRPSQPVTYATVAKWAHQLMAILGYDRFGVGGDDFGAGVATFMALQHPDRIVGLHLTHLEFRPPLGPGTPPLTPEEQSHQDAIQAWVASDHGFAAIQRSRPGALSVAMADSPSGMAAWILDKWHGWADHRGSLDSLPGRDFLVTTLTLFWVTQTFETSILDYLDNAAPEAKPGDHDLVDSPTAVVLFRQYGNIRLPSMPRSWAARRYNVKSWEVKDEGGHFAPIEIPHVVAESIRQFFGEL